MSFSINEHTYALKENEQGDVVIVSLEEEAPLKAQDQHGTSIPFPIIKAIKDIIPDKVTVFIIQDRDIVTITGDIIDYWQIEKGTNVFSAFPLAASLSQDFKELVAEMNEIIRRYLIVLCDDTIDSAFLLAKVVEINARQLLRKSSHAKAMVNQKALFQLAWNQRNIQSAADHIIQAPDVNKSQDVILD